MINKDTLKQLFSEQLKGSIWKIVLDDKEQLMCLETRTPDRETCFYLYDFKQNRFLWTEEKLNSSIPLMLHSCADGIVYFQTLKSGAIPELAYILAFGAYDSTLLFEKYTHNLELVTEKGLLVYSSKILPKKLELLDLRSGDFIRNIAFHEIDELHPIGNLIFLPENHDHPEPWLSYQQLTYGSYLIKSFYTANSPGYDQILKVDYLNQQIFQDNINEHIQKLHYDTFFVWFDKLIYIRNKQEIVSYLL